MAEKNSWQMFRDGMVDLGPLGLSVDFSRMELDSEFLKEMEKPLGRCYEELDALEGGAIANPDENRQVGHYWLRAPERAPNPQIEAEIRQTWTEIEAFAQGVHSGQISGGQGRPFTQLLLVGVGGSSLGPRFLADALGKPRQPLQPHFIDNTDPDGIDRVLAGLEGKLAQTLTIVVSKSGKTIETRNGLIEVRQAYRRCDLTFARHAAAITQKGSDLDNLRETEGWLAGFPVWDWVGGRTSVLSAVGLVPLRLLGIDTEALLAGARACDQATRRTATIKNPSALLALAWYKAGGGQGGGQMVVLPYKDRLELFGKYLQQLVMESLGKERDIDGRIVRQGLTVWGNKGSSDQHSYIQQLLDGPNNFFAVFVEVLADRVGQSVVIAENSTSGDYLQAFRLGARQALTDRGRLSLTIFLDQVDALRLGALIALFERAVTFYAFLTHINAYHQPAVEMGKKNAGEIIVLKNRVLSFLQSRSGSSFTVEEVARELRKDDSGEEETIFCLLQRLSANPQYGIAASTGASGGLFDRRYRYEAVPETTFSD